MKRIPCGNGSVADNLVDTTEVQIALYNRPSVFVPARFPVVPSELQTAIQFVSACWAVSWTCNPAETRFPGHQGLADSDLVRRAAHDRIRAHQLVGLHRRRETRSVPTSCCSGTASPGRWWRPRPDGPAPGPSATSSSRSCSTSSSPGISTDRVLNGPTNDVWLHPWLAYLRGARGHLPLRRRGEGHPPATAVGSRRHHRSTGAAPSWRGRPLPRRAAGRAHGRAGHARRWRRPIPRWPSLPELSRVGRVDERHPVLPHPGRAAGARPHHLPQLALGPDLGLAGAVLAELST